MTVYELLRDMGTTRHDDIITICDDDTLEELASFKWEADGKGLSEIRKSEYANKEVEKYNIEIGSKKTVLVTAQLLTTYWLEWKIYIYREEQ